MSIGQTLESAAMRAVILERDKARSSLASGVSVIIPCFDQSAYLPESLGSVLAQTLPPLEVIVVDDGSSEDIATAVATIAAEHDLSRTQVSCLRVANRGLPSARNAGLMNALGDALLPLDADDWLEPTYLEKALPLLAKADVVFAGLQEHGERNGIYMPGCELGLDGLTLDAERNSNRLFYCALVRTRLLREVGGWNGRMIHGYEDWDLWVDLMQRGARFAAVNEVLFHYRTRADGMLAETERHWRDWNLDEMARHHGYERIRTPRSRPPRRRHISLRDQP
jgi:glycosyltransferase involved in cell wall biosynthesis